MDPAIIKAVKERSASYSFKLWNRIQQNQIDSEDENRIFTAVKEWASGFDFHAESHSQDELTSFLCESPLDFLPSFLFRPSSTADIFINCHDTFMNHVIPMTFLR